jgi:hypothetical protein
MNIVMNLPVFRQERKKTVPGFLLRCPDQWKKTNNNGEHIRAAPSAHAPRTKINVTHANILQSPPVFFPEEPLHTSRWFF